MTLRLFNSFSNKKEEFTSVKPKLVRMYNCGPTVYNFIHVGNFASFLFADILRRYLEFKGFKVEQVMNITDVGHLVSEEDQSYEQTAGEDKIEVQAKKELKSPEEISEFYGNAFIEDYKKLLLKEPKEFTWATKNVNEMIEVIKVLLEKGFAYKGLQGENIYFDIKKFKDYGKLSKFNLEELKSTSRVMKDFNKKNQLDFVLWFNESKYKGHLMQWDSPFGRGYPGWHIECSAMSMKYLSKSFSSKKFEPEKFETIDIHTGGEDNLFPHHECEIAQSEAATGKKFVNYWLHRRHLLVEGQKMSKSKGNYFTLRDLFEKGFSARAIRFVLISGHYRDKLNFTLDSLNSAEKSVDRLNDFVLRLKELKGLNDFNISSIIKGSKKEFICAMDDDLNTPKALAVLFEFVTVINKLIDEEKIGRNEAKRILSFLKDINSVFEIIDLKIKRKTLSKEIMKLIEKREEFRKEKNFNEADKIRNELLKQGIQLLDSKEGVKWKKVQTP